MFGKKRTVDRPIDMHCHILPGIDDGSHDMAMTLQMLKIAQKEGITDMIVTPHYKISHHNASREKIDRLITEVTKEAKMLGIDINLYPGNEVYYFDEIDTAIENNDFYTLNNTNRLLVEFTPTDQFTYIRNGLDKIRSMDMVPVLAHIERYECIVSHPEHAYELYDMGVEIQVNASSIEGALGKKVKKFLLDLLEDGIVSYVGTDAHNIDKRAPKLHDALDIMHKNLDAEYVEDITRNNSLALIEA